MAPLDEDQFCTFVAQALYLTTPPPINAHLFDELALDSLQAYELIAAIEAITSGTPSDALPLLITMTDAYSFYLSQFYATTDS